MIGDGIGRAASELVMKGFVMAKVKGAKMVDSPRARIWLSKSRAHITALSKELKTANDEEAFALLYELRGKLWYEQEDFSSCDS